MISLWVRIRITQFVVLAAFMCAGSPMVSAQLLVDRAQQVDGLWVVPNRDDPNRFNYLPQVARISRNDDGDPLFSLTFYISEEAVAVDEDEGVAHSIVSADGGAILHVLMEYGTDPGVVNRAEQSLRRRLDNDEISITGPVIFDEGTFSVISSVLTSEGARSATMLAQRPAPVLEGQRVALSFELEPRLANILLATLKTATPDLSVTFDLSFHGLTEAYNAEMIIDWKKTKDSLQAAAGVQVYVVSVDAQAAIEKMFQGGAIKLVVSGDDDAMESIVQLAYNKALEIMYAPIEVEDVPEKERGGLMDAIGMMLGGRRGVTSAAVGFGLFASYRMKKLRSEGKTRLSFDKRGTVRRNAMLTVNLGDLYSQYGQNERFFRVESTGDPDFDQRRVFVLVDGALRPEIGAFVNSVEVALRKHHGSGDVTMRELVVNTTTADENRTLGPLTYNNLRDPDIESWLQYDFKTVWDFRGGGKYESEWSNSSAATIGLTAPFHRQLVEIDGDLKALSERGVLAIVVEITNDFFGKRKTQRRSIRPTTGDKRIEPISLVMPEGVFDYQYKITWVFENGARRESTGVDDLGFVFLDDIPGENSSGGNSD